VESPRGIGRRGSNCNGFVVFAFAVVDPAEVPAVFGACFGASAITAWSNIVAAANRTATAVFAFATHYEMLQRAMVFGYCGLQVRKHGLLVTASSDMLISCWTYAIALS
jgi:hypothetical protein